MNSSYCLGYVRVNFVFLTQDNKRYTPKNFQVFKTKLSIYQIVAYMIDGEALRNSGCIKNRKILQKVSSAEFKNRKQSFPRDMFVDLITKLKL